MAVVAQVFQDNVFQNNAFQGEWGGVTFQKNVFQNNVFDVPLTVTKIVNESLNNTETAVTTRELLRLVNESVSVQQFRIRLRALVKFVIETNQVSETVKNTRGLMRLANESIESDENLLRYQSIIRNLAETSQVSDSRLSLRGIKRIISNTLNIGEARTRVKSIVKTVSDMITIGLSAFQSNVYQNNVFGSAISEVTKVLGRVKTVTETSQLSETKTPLNIIKRVINNTVNITKINIPTIIRADRAPVLPSSKVEAKALGISATIPEKIIKEI